MTFTQSQLARMVGVVASFQLARELAS